MDTRISRLLLLRSYYLVPKETANGTETFSTHPKSNPVSHFLRNFLLSSLRSESPAWYIVQGGLCWSVCDYDNILLFVCRTLRSWCIRQPGTDAAGSRCQIDRPIIARSEVVVACGYGCRLDVFINLRLNVNFG